MALTIITKPRKKMCNRLLEISEALLAQASDYLVHQ